MVVFVAAAAGASAAPDATNPPTPRQPTCAERYPADGPAGVDLQLGCIVTELMGAYTGTTDAGGAPPRVSAWLGPLAAVGAGLALLYLVARSVRRAAGRRLAPVVPRTWWSCPRCRSLNAVGVAACYRCGYPWDAGIPELHEGDQPPPQSFGRPPGS